MDNSYGQDLWKDKLLSSVRGLSIPVIDTELAIIESGKAGLNAWFYCPGSHFNATGAKVAADQIIKRLAEEPN